MAELLPRTIAECIDACNLCLRAVNECLATHAGDAEMKRCLLLCLDCKDLCRACVESLARQSAIAPELCAICADHCGRCAEECGRFDSEVCRRCAEACSRCAEQCRRVAA